MTADKTAPPQETADGGGSAAPAEPPRGTVSPPAAPPAEPEPDWETRFKYLLADFENFRKRSDREREAIRQRERAELLLSLLPIHEALDRARHAVAKAPKNDPVRRGMELVARELDAFLDRSGVQPVASVGRPFDATQHEAVVEAAATAKTPDGSIVEIVQQGYRFPGGLLRAAKVVVARAPPAARPPEAPAAASGTTEAANESGPAETHGKD